VDELFSGTCLMVSFIADASPLEVNTALMSSGSWGVVHESNASGVLNAGVLNNTNNVLVNTAMFHAVNFEPQTIQVSHLSIPEYTSCVTSPCAYAEMRLQDIYLYKMHAHANQIAVQKYTLLLLASDNFWHLFGLPNASSAKADSHAHHIHT